MAIRQGRPGEAKHVIPIVLGVDHYLKLVIVVDDDIDVFDESDVMWAVATGCRPTATSSRSAGAWGHAGSERRGQKNSAG